LQDESIYLKSDDLNITYKGNITFNSGSPEKIRRFEFKYKLEDGEDLTGIVNGGVVTSFGNITINKTPAENYTITYDSHSLDTGTNELTVNAVTSGEVVLNDGEDLDYTWTVKNTSGVNKLFAISGDPELIVADSKIIKTENTGKLSNRLLQFKYPAKVFKENPQGGYYIADKEKVCSYDERGVLKWEYVDTASGDIQNLAIYPDGKVVIFKRLFNGVNDISLIIQRVLNNDGTENTSYTNFPLEFRDTDSNAQFALSPTIINNRLAFVLVYDSVGTADNWSIYYYEADYSGLKTIVYRRGLVANNNSFYTFFDANAFGVTEDYKIRKYDMPTTGAATQDVSFFPNTQIKFDTLLINDGFIYGADISTSLLKKVDLTDDTVITTVNYGGNLTEILGTTKDKIYIQESLTVTNRIEEYDKATLTLDQTFEFSNNKNSDELFINRNLLAIPRNLDTKDKGLEILNPTQNQLYEINENGFNNQLIVFI